MNVGNHLISRQICWCFLFVKALKSHDLAYSFVKLYDCTTSVFLEANFFHIFFCRIAVDRFNRFSPENILNESI